MQGKLISYLFVIYIYYHKAYKITITFFAKKLFIFLLFYDILVLSKFCGVYMKFMKNNNDFIKFLKTNWIKLFLILCSLIIIIALSLFIVPNWLGRNKFTDELSNFANKSSVFSLSEIYCYSSASGINNTEGKAMWDVNVSQYTDIALGLSINNVNNDLTNNLGDSNSQVVDTSPKYSISKIYIDNISFSNNNTGTLSLSYIPILNFGLISNEELTNPAEQQSKIDFNIVNDKETLLNNTVSEPSIDKNLILPITLRYLNSNIKTDHTITNIEEKLAFDGSILKRASIPLSSIKNEVTFNIHIVTNSSEEYMYPVHLQIPLQNEDNSKNIYDGSYSQELEFNNCYFY